MVVRPEYFASSRANGEWPSDPTVRKVHCDFDSELFENTIRITFENARGLRVDVELLSVSFILSEAAPTLRYDM
jgi:hypothetical protein